MVNVSRHSKIAQRQKSLRPDQAWYDDVIDVATQDCDRLNEEDLIIAIESSIHVFEFKKKFAKNRRYVNKSLQEEEFETGKDTKSLWEKIDIFGIASFLRGKNLKKFTHARTYEEVSSEIGADEDAISEYESIAILSTESEEREGLFGTSGGGSEGPLHKFLNSECTSTRKKLVALISWGLACFGLLIALIYLTRDFASSQRVAARTIQYIPSHTLNFPKLWFCTAHTGLPPFTEIVPPYKGAPLTWIDFLKGSNANLNITYPETMKISQYAHEVINVQGNACNASTKMDPEMYYEENSKSPSCFHCMALVRNPAIGLSEVSDQGRSSRLSVRLSKQAFLSRCRTSQSRLTEGLLHFFRAEMKNNSLELQQANILDFSGFDASDSSNDGILWPYYRHGMMNTTVDYNVYDVVDMFCNVYMFSGFFYPTTAQDVRFRFNRVILRWERSGQGPYYPPSYSEYYHPIQSNVDLDTSGVICTEEYENRSVFSGTSIHVMTNVSNVGGAATLAVLEPSDMAEVSFERHEVNGRELMPATVLRSAIETGDVRGINFVYFIEFGFSSFLTRQVTDQQAMSWTAFLADFFGLTSLFLDLSVYTIIVSPISGRREEKIKRKNSEQGVRLSKRGYETSEEL